MLYFSLDTMSLACEQSRPALEERSELGEQTARIGEETIIQDPRLARHTHQAILVSMGYLFY